MTKTEAIIKYLTEERRMIEVTSPSRKRRKFVGKSPTGKTVTFWIGRKGGVRVGNTISASVSITSVIKASTIIWGEVNEKS